MSRYALVTGTAGSGKTRLLYELSLHARSGRAHVLPAGCTRFSRTDSLGIPRQLLGPAAEPAPDTETEINAAVSTILHRTAQGVVVVCVDDVHHADPASMRFLRKLAIAGAGHRLLVVTTGRARMWHGSCPAAEELWAAFDVRRIALGPLAHAEIAELARRDFQLRPTDSFTAAVRTLTNGNPLLIRALLADNTAGRRLCPDGDPLVGPAYREAVLDLLHRLDSGVREVAELFALAGDFGTPAVIVELAGTDSTRVEQSRCELMATGLVHANRFRHPAAQEAVLYNMSRSRRASLCRSAAGVLRACGARAEDVARWLAAVEDLDTHVIHGAPGAPSPIESDRPAPARPARPVDAARTLWQANGSLASIDRLLAAQRPPDSPDAVELKASRLLIGCDFPGLLECDLLEASFATDHAARSARFGAAWSLARVLTGTGDALPVAQRSLAMLELAHDTMSAIAAALTAATRSGDPDLARSACDRFVDESARRGAAAWQAQLLGVRADLLVRVGDVAAGAADAESALELLPARLWGPALGGTLAALLLAYTSAGNLAAATARLRQPTLEAVYDTRYGLDFLYARGHYHLAMGHHLPALADFLRCGRQLTDWGLDREGLVPWRLAVAATYVAMGDYGKAVTSIDEVMHAWSALPADVGTSAREVIFELLRDTAGTPGLLAAMCGLRDRLPPAGDLAVPRYKISDRFATCLDKLSPSEQRVATLAAKGATNQKIAHELSITVSTVEQHLTRTYRKLDLAGRADLRRMLG